MKVYVLTLDSIDDITGNSSTDVFEGVYADIKDVLARVNEIIRNNELLTISMRPEDIIMQMLKEDDHLSYVGEANNIFYRLTFFVKECEMN